MAPKTNCNPLKLASILTYIQASRVAHNIKDLEKHLPSVASINGMQVKDYIQALSDDSKIRVEKIGSGNWYWSFPSEEKQQVEKNLAEAKAAHAKAEAVVADLQAKVSAAQEQQQADAEEEDEGGESREVLGERKAKLQGELAVLRKELAGCGDADPTILEKKREEIGKFKQDVETHSDAIINMEAWMVDVGGDEYMCGKRRELYGDQLDEESCMLKEI
ncbi:hypothetical protein B0A48_07328 [Cryoendolithus antarcticus]|uniref:Mnd1 HTH domain-containing protein n=1 Tax=Cryoendolithus antarcticus TaxID=1507870 RepID=A0A1V8T8Q5_9PEZI|nr:hypothetical protein B0A48_07328 [Cryoendolithus antarcticus]